jgi:hypothetical protein
MKTDTDLDKAAAKKAATRIGAVAGASAADIVGKMFANWAIENPQTAEKLFARAMSLAAEFVSQKNPDE